MPYPPELFTLTGGPTGGVSGAGAGATHPLLVMVLGLVTVEPGGDSSFFKCHPYCHRCNAHGGGVLAPVTVGDRKKQVNSWL